MDQISASFAAFARDERGATAIEYGFIVCLISIGIVTGVTQIGQTVQGFFSAMGRGFGSH